MRPILAFAALLALALPFTAPCVQAQVRFLPYVGYHLNAGYDFDEALNGNSDELETTGGFIVGVGAEFGVTPGFLPVVVKVRPSVETVFLPSADVNIVELNRGGGDVEISQSAYQASLDLIAEFSPPAAPIVPYAGAGVTYVMYSAEGSFSGTDEESDGSAIGLNLLGGIRFGGGFVAPFVQGRYSLADPTPEDFEDDGVNEIGNGISFQAGVSLGL